MHYVYIIKSLETGMHYYGESKDYRERLERHNAGRSKATKGKGPWKSRVACRVEDKSGILNYSRSRNYLTSAGKEIKPAFLNSRIKLYFSPKPKSFVKRINIT